MSCLDAAAVQRYLDGEVDTTARGPIEAHLAGCGSCRSRISALAATDAGAALAATAVGVATVAIGGVGATALDRPGTGGAPPGHRALEIGTVVDRYRVTGQLGRGGMGIVYAAHDLELRRDVALKLLHPGRASFAGAAELQERLVREAQAMARITHPNVLAVFDVGTWNGEVFVAIELATGGTLRAWCTPSRTPAQILEAYLAAGRGLAAAHAAGLVHRDFKPDNVLLGADGRVRVTDFGLARVPDGAPDRAAAGADPSPAASLTATGAILGTPAYMSPELHDGEPADASTDQFAFCVALWEALYGRRPFAGATLPELAEAVHAGRIVDPPERRRTGRAIEIALRRGLSPQREARWPSMDALLAALTVRPRRRWRYAAAAAVLAIGGGAAAVAAMRAPPSPASSALPPSAPLAIAARDAGVDAVDLEAVRALDDVVSLVTRSMTHMAAGQVAEANADLAQAVAHARTYRVPSVLITALVDQAGGLKNTGDLVGAERALREARRIAEATGDDARKTQISADLAEVLASEGKREEADDVRAMSQATAARSEIDDANRARALEAEAGATRDLAAATAKWEAALALRDRTGDLFARAANRSGLANMLMTAGRSEQGRDVLLASLHTIDERSRAASGSRTGGARGSGQPAASPSRAQDDMVQITAVFARHLTLGSLIIIENDLQRWVDAEAHARAAIAVASAPALRSTLAQTLGDAYLGLGTALLGQGDRRGADAAYARALAQYAGNPLKLAIAHGSIAVAEQARHDFTRAIRHAETAVALLDKAPGTRRGARLDMQVLLCKVLGSAGRHAQARRLAEQVLPKVESDAADPLTLGDARFVLARELPAAERARAEQLAADARKAYDQVGLRGTQRIARLDAWLAELHAPHRP